MVEVAGKPVLEQMLGCMKRAGLDEFLFVVGYKREAIQSYFGDGRRWGVSVEYAVQETPNGTGAALLFGKDFGGDDPFLASYGDILTDPRHYDGLLANFAQRPCAAVIGINPMDPSQGAAAFHEDGRLLGVKEKPKPGEPTSDWNLAGVSIYGPEVWAELEALKPSARGEYEITDAIGGLIRCGREVRVEEMRGFWSDIGTPEALAEAEREWRDRFDHE
jgi:dTDP-glucose pyrophosphorylase